MFFDMALKCSDARGKAPVKLPAPLKAYVAPPSRVVETGSVGSLKSFREVLVGTGVNPDAGVHNGVGSSIGTRLISFDLEDQNCFVGV